MANSEHLSKVKAGADIWNSWIATLAAEFEADLSGANLSGLDLSGARLTNANLIGAHLVDTNLVDANLTGAYLTRADLSDAQLTRAILRGANLMGANIRGANLVGADLVETNLCLSNFYFAKLNNADLRCANLTGADLSRAELCSANLSAASLFEMEVYETLFVDTDFSDVLGAESISHRGPSTVDHRTLRKSLPALPRKFLRESGLSSWQIESAKLLQADLSDEAINDIGYNIIRMRGQQPIQLYSLFISHSSQDSLFAHRLYDDLQKSGVNCWLAEEDLKIGDRFKQGIDEAIHLHDKLLVILSSRSVGSYWVQYEVETALDKERVSGQSVLFPLKTDHSVDTINADWAAEVRRRHIGDFTQCDRPQDYKSAFDRVLRDLRAQ